MANPTEDPDKSAIPYREANPLKTLVRVLARISARDWLKKQAAAVVRDPDMTEQASKEANRAEPSAKPTSRASSDRE